MRSEVVCFFTKAFFLRNDVLFFLVKNQLDINFAPHRSKELSFVVPAALLHAIVFIGAPATWHPSRPCHGSEQCPGLTASGSSRTKNKGPAPAMLNQFETKYELKIDL